MEFEDRAAEYAPKLEALQRELASGGVEFIEVHTVDTSGAFRSKIAPLKLSTYGESINAILYCVTHGDGQPMGDVAFASPSANEENGFPNIKGIIDPATVVRHGWKPKFASAITRSYMLDGAVCPFDPRGVLARVEERARALGYEPMFALEYEFGIFHADHDLMRAGRYRELKPWGHSLINYDLVRSGEYQDFAAEFITRMKSIGIGVASLVTVTRTPLSTDDKAPCASAKSRMALASRNWSGPIRVCAVRARASATPICSASSCCPLARTAAARLGSRSGRRSRNAL